MNRSLEALDLNLINVLHWILTEGSVTGAAGRLGLSQPAVSRSLGRLRDIYQDPLVVPQGRKMVPTPLGQELMPLVGQAVVAMRHVAAAGGAFDPATSEGTFRIATKDSSAIGLLETWERDIRPLAPGLALDFVILDPSIGPEMESGDIDLAVMMLFDDMPLPDSVDLTQYVMRTGREEKWLTYLRKDHPLAGRKLTLKEYTELDHIMCNPLRAATSSVDDWLEERGMNRRISYRTQTILLSKAILRRTDCALTCLEGLFESSPGEVWASPTPVPISPGKIHMGWHPNWTLNPRHKWVRDRLLAGLQAPLQMAA